MEEEPPPVFPLIPSESFWYLFVERTNVYLYESEEDISNNQLLTFDSCLQILLLLSKKRRRIGGR